MAFVHENLRFKSILETIAEQKQIDIKMVEKDYWIMHSLWGLQNLKLDFYLKGGTSGQSHLISLSFPEYYKL